MVTEVVYITKQTTYKALRELLISTPHLRSYPLVTDDGKILNCFRAFSADFCSILQKPLIENNKRSGNSLLFKEEFMSYFMD